MSGEVAVPGSGDQPERSDRPDGAEARRHGTTRPALVPDWPVDGPAEADDLPVEGPGSVPPIWLRAAARTIDSVIVGMVGFTLLSLTAERQPDDTFIVPAWAQLAVIVFWYLYETIPVWAWGRTPGKRLVGLVVVDRRTGAAPGLNRAALRVIVVIAAAFVGAAFGLAPAAIVVTYGSAVFGGTLKRNWPDRAGDTVVVRSA